MKNWATKKNVLIVSVFGVLLALAFANPVTFGICTDTYKFSNYTGCLDKLPEVLTEILFPLTSLLVLLSLLTFFMREEVFRAWWNFARWWIPIIMVGTILCNLMPSNRGFFNMDALIYLMVLAPLYSILILGSLWKIIRTHLRLKKEGK